MRNVTLTGLVVVLSLYVSASERSRGTAMVILPQRDSPAALVSTTHTTADLLSTATLKSVHGSLLTSYRIGWVVAFRSGKSEVHLGPSRRVLAGIKPGKTWDVPAQGITPRYAKQGASALVFFVAAAGLADGTTWKADLADVKERARQIASQ